MTKEDAAEVILRTTEDDRWEFCPACGGPKNVNRWRSCRKCGLMGKTLKDEYVRACLVLNTEVPRFRRL